MIQRRGKNAQNPSARPTPGRPPARPEPPNTFHSEPLRQEAERGWEESDRSTADGLQRRIKKARAQKRRRQSSREKDALIASLKAIVTRLEKELAKHVHHRQD